MAHIEGNKIHIDLTSEDGNVFALFGIGQQIIEAAEAEGDTLLIWDAACASITSRTYEENLQMFDLLFGEFIVWENTPDKYISVLARGQVC